MAFALILAISFVSCDFLKPKTVILRIEGSDTMQNFTELLAREYMRRHPNVAIYVYGGGSGEGIEALAKGEVDIATASRLLKPEEVKKLADQYGSVGMHFLVAKDAISVYTHPDNPIKDISMDQLRKIYTCRINNWAEIGGNDSPINLYTRNPNSGTYSYFRHHVLAGEKYCFAATTVPTAEKMISSIAKDPNGIGYGGIGFHDGVNHILINGVEAVEDNVRNDLYPISRYLYFFTLRNPRGEVKEFIDWALSNDAQKYIKQAGYVPIWKVKF